MTLNKEQMREYQRKRRAKCKPDVNQLQNVNLEDVNLPACKPTEYSEPAEPLDLQAIASFPDLPYDPIISVNEGISWLDVLKLSRQTIDLVYHTAIAMDDSILLRLRRAAGYHKRTSC